MTEFEEKRKLMVVKQLEARGLKSRLVLDAMASTPRHLFLPEGIRNRAYEDRALSIGHGQTISQPYMVAIMTEKLEVEPEHKILEIGTGSGYQACILAQLADRVYTIERHSALAESAKTLLGELGHDNVHVIVGDGTLGHKKEAPYDRIIVTAGAPKIPKPLVQQLAPDGILVVPVGPRQLQSLKIVRKGKKGVKEETSIGCVFVPLIGKRGW